MVSAASFKQKAFFYVSVVGGVLFRSGILYQRIPGVEVGPALVGLQRLSSGSERTDLSAGRSVLWPGRHGAELLSHAPVHEAVPQNLTQMAVCPVRCIFGGVSAGYHVLCGQSQYGIRNFGIRNKKYAKTLPKLNLLRAVL